MTHPAPLPALPLPLTTELAGPVPRADRIAALDVLRGVAVLGILVMNVQSFAMIQAAYFNPRAWGDLTGANWWVWFISHLLFDQKFITLFSMLFGAGIVLMSGRLEARGRHPTGMHYRRMAVLLVMGLLHAHLLWYGDILYAYAICGMVVYWCRRWPPWVQVILGLLGVGIGWMLWTLMVWSLPYMPEEAREELMLMFWPTQQMVSQELAAYRGGWIEQMSHRVPTSAEYQTISFIMYTFWWTSGMMLIGMAMFRWGILAATASWRVYALMLLAGAAGLGAIVLGVLRGGRLQADWLNMGDYNYWASLLVALGWIALVMLVCRRGWLITAQRLLADVGRMALTNYLLQTVICTTIFYGHGFGLFGRVERTGQVAIVVAVWIVLLICSRLWMSRFAYGPAEWAWRAATYLTRPPLRRRSAAE
jgi:uncharacterized protein